MTSAPTPSRMDGTDARMYVEYNNIRAGVYSQLEALIDVAAPAESATKLSATLDADPETQYGHRYMRNELTQWLVRLQLAWDELSVGIKDLLFVPIYKAVIISTVLEARERVAFPRIPPLPMNKEDVPPWCVFLTSKLKDGALREAMETYRKTNKMTADDVDPGLFAAFSAITSIKKMETYARAAAGGVIAATAWQLWRHSRRQGNVMLSVFTPRTQLAHAAVAVLLLLWAAPIPHNERDAWWLHTGAPTTAWLALFAMLCSRLLPVCMHRSLLEAGLCACSGTGFIVLYVLSLAHPPLMYMLMPPFWAALALLAAGMTLAAPRAYDYAQDVRRPWVRVAVALALAAAVALPSPPVPVLLPWVAAAWHALSTVLPVARMRYGDVLFVPDMANHHDATLNQEGNYGALPLGPGDTDADGGEDDLLFLAGEHAEDAERWYVECHRPYVCSSGRWPWLLEAVTDPERFPDLPELPYDPDMLADAVLYVHTHCPEIRPRGVPPLAEEARFAWYVRRYAYEHAIVLYGALVAANRAMPGLTERTLACWHLRQRFMDNPADPHRLRPEHRDDAFMNTLNTRCTLTPAQQLANAERDRPINLYCTPVEFTEEVCRHLGHVLDTQPGLQRFRDADPGADDDAARFLAAEFLPRVRRLHAARLQRFRAAPPSAVRILALRAARAARAWW